MLCNGCDVRPEWQGEHRCHAPKGGPPQRMVFGWEFSIVGNCSCEKCKVMTKEEIQAILNKAQEQSGE